MMKFFSTVVLLGGLLVALSGVGRADSPTILVSASLESGGPFLELKCAVTNLAPTITNAKISIIDSDGKLCDIELAGSAYCSDTTDSDVANCKIPPGAIGWVNCANGRNDYCKVVTNAQPGAVFGSLAEQLDLPSFVIGTPVVATFGALDLHQVSP
jgi:hypothetical protein